MVKGLTEKEHKLVKEFVENGGNGTQAALKAYDTSSPANAAAIASRELKKPEVVSELAAELKRQNITLEAALQPIADALRDEDIEVRLKGSDRALKLLLPRQNANLNLNLNIDAANFGGECVLDEEEEEDETETD